MSQFAEELRDLLGLDGVDYHYGLDKKQLFQEALQFDKGRIRPDGPDDEHKAYQTKLGDKGPLIFFTDPTCTGRPVADTFAVARSEIEDKVWWKKDFGKYDPEKYDALLKRVVEHCNANKTRLYVKDVYCGTDAEYAVPFRFVGEYATHAMFIHNMFPKELEGIADEDGKRWDDAERAVVPLRPRAGRQQVGARGGGGHRQSLHPGRRSARTTPASARSRCSPS
jgi:phosphoenolpyruvate carboxykinase (ATP)